MEIQGAGAARGPQPIYARMAPTSVELAQPTQVGVARDHVEISALGQLLDSINRLPEIRQERVSEIRAQITSGVYETPEKFEIALDRMMGEFDFDSDSE